MTTCSASRCAVLVVRLSFSSWWSLHVRCTFRSCSLLKFFAHIVHLHQKGTLFTCGPLKPTCETKFLHVGISSPYVGFHMWVFDDLTVLFFTHMWVYMWDLKSHMWNTKTHRRYPTGRNPQGEFHMKLRNNTVR